MRRGALRREPVATGAATEELSARQPRKGGEKCIRKDYWR